MPEPRLPLRVAEEVADALRDGSPIVALESNVISHGLTYPRNIEAARGVETAVRRAGAVPATIAVDNGKILVGLDDDELERLATQTGVPKVSSRDLGYVLASGELGATTVASSLVVAEASGLRWFASAGLGGVHRGAERTFDISSDLIQLTRSRVAVVCAGAKNILDIGLTLEYLETQCVPVVAFQSIDFPAFYCATSGFRSPLRVDDGRELGDMIDLHWAMGSPTGVVVTSPPRAADAIDVVEAEAAVAAALEEAARAGVTGKAVTRFLMHAIDRMTGGRSADANQSVLMSTAATAGAIAVEDATRTRQLQEAR